MAYLCPFSLSSILCPRKQMKIPTSVNFSYWIESSKTWILLYFHVNKHWEEIRFLLFFCSNIHWLRVFQTHFMGLPRIAWPMCLLGIPLLVQYAAWPPPLLLSLPCLLKLPEVLNLSQFWPDLSHFWSSGSHSSSSNQTSPWLYSRRLWFLSSLLDPDASPHPGVWDLAL